MLMMVIHQTKWDLLLFMERGQRVNQIKTSYNKFFKYIYVCMYVYMYVCICICERMRIRE